MGSRQYYLPSRKPGHGTRCSECALTQSCEFYLDLDADPKLRSLYRENEHFDHYYRDGCVFSEDINIEDTMSALIRYPNQIQVTYGLTAATAFEGWQVAFNGSLGRLEAFEPECFVAETESREFQQRSRGRRSVDWRTAQADEAPDLKNLSVKFFPLFGGVQTFEVAHQSQGHGGGDRRLKDHLFRGVNEDPLGHAAGSRAGAMSILVGVAANQSIAEGRFVRIEDLLLERTVNDPDPVVQPAGH